MCCGSGMHCWGYAFSLNNLSILHLLPFLDSLLDGSFAKTEEEANIVPFKIRDVSFNWLVVFVDGIYPTQ
jgi:hypothetical protein